MQQAGSKHTWEGKGETEKPRSEARERASDMPPMRLIGFLPTQVESFPIDIFKPQEAKNSLYIQIEVGRLSLKAQIAY